MDASFMIHLQWPGHGLQAEPPGAGWASLAMGGEGGNLFFRVNVCMCVFVCAMLCFYFFGGLNLQCESQHCRCWGWVHGHFVLFWVSIAAFSWGCRLDFNAVEIFLCVWCGWSLCLDNSNARVGSKHVSLERFLRPEGRPTNIHMIRQTNAAQLDIIAVFK